jgi:hypothetical protein
MDITSYESLLAAAKTQSQPQRLLFTFTRAEQDGRTAAPGRRTGTLTPVMCVDKLPEELSTFAVLEEESRNMQLDWDVVFVACMGGQNGAPPASGATDLPFKQMIASIEGGQIGGYLAFNRAGELLRFD